MKIDTLVDYVHAVARVRHLQNEYFKQSALAKKTLNADDKKKAADFLIESKKIESILDKANKEILLRAIALEDSTKKLSASEALYGFMGWLTCRKEVLTLSSAHEVPPVPELIGEFIEKQGLMAVREDWTTRMVPMQAREGGVENG